MIQAVLTFGVETWLATHRMGKALGGFQTQVEIRLTGKLPRRTTDRMWRYTSTAAARDEVGLLTMEDYMSGGARTRSYIILLRNHC